MLVAHEKLGRSDEGGSLVRELLSSAAHLHTDPENKTLTVQIHRLATPGHDEALRHPCEELTGTDTLYPGTDLRLVFPPVRATLNPRGPGS